MLEGLKTILELLLVGVQKFKTTRRERLQDATITELLTAYFLFRDLIATGRELLTLAGADPVQKVTAMPEEDRKGHVHKCHDLLVLQRFRLRLLSEIVFGQALLDVIDPPLRHEIDKAIGDKTEQSVLSAGAGIEFYLLFGAMPTEEELTAHGKELASYRYQGRIIGRFLDAKKNIIDVPLAAMGLERLEEVSLRLLNALKAGFEQDDLVRLANAAEKRAAELETNIGW